MAAKWFKTFQYSKTVCLRVIADAVRIQINEQNKQTSREHNNVIIALIPILQLDQLC